MARPSRIRALRFLIRLAISGVAFFVFALHVAGMPRFEVLDRVENYLYDVRIRLTMPATIDDRIVIIDIDETSQLALGQWPWPRDTLATLVDRLFDDYGVAVLGLDVLFAERGRDDGNEAFAESFIARDVVTGFVFRDSLSPREPVATGSLPPPIIRGSDLAGVNVPFVTPAGYTGSLPELQDNAAAGGFFDAPLIDSDGVFRRAPLVQQYDGDLYPSLALAVAHVALGRPAVGLRFASTGDGRMRGIDLESFTLGQLDIPVNERVAVFIPYRGPQESFPYVPAVDVIDGTADATRLAGRIALLGASAAGLLDLRSTPVGQRYIGVEAHANLVAGLVDGNIRRQPAYSDGLEIVLLLVIAIVTAFALPRLGPFSSLTLVVSVIALSMLLNLWMWSSLMLVVPLATILVYTFVAALLHISYGFFIEQRNKRHLSHIFGQYIPPSLVEEIDQSGADVSLEGETREMSVLFSDVRSFTTISEGIDARELTQLMNEFLTPFTRAIQEHRGTIDKYMGDCVMAFWGAPLADAQHAEHALQAAFDMLEAVRGLDEPFRAKGWPAIRVGVGIASGMMNVGNMGSEFRVAYTVMGDTVNLGSRLEGLTKQYGVDIIVSDRTTELATDFVYRELDLVRVKGKTRPVSIHEPLGRRDALPSDTLRELDDYVKALASYRGRDFERARALFSQLANCSDALLYTVYLDRIDRFQSAPPADDWDGVFDHLIK
ncbi:MAG: adenylate/guanylate cyclase domain-containing protein [Woeseiaceae bacterium]|nr:adenylate/guanylate cyclase domain-containing protein [Woeseiaceae bacterium]